MRHNSDPSKPSPSARTDVTVPVRVYLDTNAVTCLFMRPAGRAALAAACKNGRIHLIASLGLAEELVGLQPTQPALYASMIEFIYDLAGRRILLPVEERMKIEVTRRARLCEDVLYLDADMRHHFRNSLTDPNFTAEVNAQVTRFKARFEADRFAGRKLIRQRLGRDTTLWTRRWFAEAAGLVDDWVADDFRLSRDGLALPTDETSWPAPREVFSAWHNRAFQLTRIALTVGENRKIRGSDLWDTIHYADAIYADILVTDDKGFRETCEAAPLRPFAVETFDDFMNELLNLSR